MNAGVFKEVRFYVYSARKNSARDVGSGPWVRAS